MASYSERVRELSQSEFAGEYRRHQTPGPLSGGFFGRKRGVLEREAARRIGEQNATIFDMMDSQVETMRELAVTPEDKALVSNFATRAEYARLTGDMSNTDKFLDLGAQWVQGQENQRLGAQAAATEADAQRLAASEGLRDDMYKELQPLQVALDSFKAIAEVTDIDTPFALTAAAYKTVMLLQQGTGSRISDADLQAAQAGITSWAGWLEQQLARGAAGEGFTAEARNGLLSVLEPLARIAEDQAAQTVARADAFTQAGGYDSDVVFAGFDPSLYQRARWQPSAIPTAEEQAVLDQGREDAIAESGAAIGETTSNAIQSFFEGYIGLTARRERLAEIEAGRVRLTPEMERRLENLGGPAGLRRAIELQERGQRGAIQR